ncbi:MAG: hypothetical protein JSW28_08805 [Thermoplasmata archaeon]|nr:MAG: hypothetical protein JSW28_08805 [Thermoplasmata archaeon]
MNSENDKRNWTAGREFLKNWGGDAHEGAEDPIFQTPDAGVLRVVLLGAIRCKELLPPFAEIVPDHFSDSLFLLPTLKGLSSLSVINRAGSNLRIFLGVLFSFSGPSFFILEHKGNIIPVSVQK